jgi:uncharacterized protein (TIGR02145 family)
MKNIKQSSFFILFLSVLILSSCGTSYDRDNFKFQEFMDSNGSDIADYLQENWDIDSAMIMHLGFFKAREWSEIYPQEWKTIVIGSNSYYTSEYLDHNGFDVNAPLFVVYFSKLKKFNGNSFDDIGVNTGSLLQEKSQVGIDAAHQNWESANYNYEGRVYFMAYATYVDGEFKLLMCCDSENYYDEIAFQELLHQINNQKEFYSYSMGGGINRDMHKAKEGQIYSSPRIEFEQFLQGQQIALFVPDLERKNIQSEYELLFKGCTKPNASTLKSLDYFYMKYNGDFERNEIEKRRERLNRELREEETKKEVLRWMSENLNVDKFRNGEQIPQAKSTREWLDARSKEKPAWCYYDFDSTNGIIYGKLYNWYAVNDPRGLAPEGWHIPSGEEWSALTAYLGSYSEAGKKMRSTSGWQKNDNGTNESGFSALPGGDIDYYGQFSDIGEVGYWWSLEDKYTHEAMFSLLSSGNINRGPDVKDSGMSVRCIRD